MAESQPLDDFTVDKMHWKQWDSATKIGAKNKLPFTAQLSFTYPESGETRTLSFTPSAACVKEVHPSITLDDDDKVIEFNEFYYEYKLAVDQKIQQRMAKSAQHKVLVSPKTPELTL